MADSYSILGILEREIKLILTDYTKWADGGGDFYLAGKSISKDYMYYLFNQKLAIGVNPIMGAFPAMYTNIMSNCGAIGWFSATSVIGAEAIYHQ